MKKVLPVVVAAGALFYYDQNVNPIISRNFQRALPEKFPEVSGTATPPAFQRSDFEKAKHDAKVKGQSFTSQVSKEAEDKYNKFEAKASDFSDQASSKISEAKEDVQSRWNNLDIPNPRTKVPDLTPDENPVRGAVGSYIDWVNSVGNKIWGKKNEVKGELHKHTDDYKYGWFSFGTGHKEQLDKKYDVEKARAIKKYELAKQKLDDYKESVKGAAKGLNTDPKKQKEWNDAQKEFDNSLSSLKSYGSDVIDQANKDYEESKKAWFKWGRKKQDNFQVEYNKQKSEATKQYEAAKKYLDDLTAQIQKSNPFSSKKEQDEHLKKAQSDLSSSLTNLKKYGNDLLDNISK